MQTLDKQTQKTQDPSKKYSQSGTEGQVWSRLEPTRMVKYSGDTLPFRITRAEEGQLLEKGGNY